MEYQTAPYVRLARYRGCNVAVTAITKRDRNSKRIITSFKARRWIHPTFLTLTGRRSTSEVPVERREADSLGVVFGEIGSLGKFLAGGIRVIER